MKKNQITYFTLIFILICVYIMYQNFYILTFLISIIVMPLFSFVIFRFSINKIKFDVSIKNQYVKASDDTTKIPVNILITNLGTFPLLQGIIIVKISNSLEHKILKEKLNIAGAAKNETRITYYINSKNIGNINMFFDYVALYDFLGLFKNKQKMNVSKQITILPQNIILNNEDRILEIVKKKNINEFNPNIQKGMDKTIVYDLREYKENDNLRDVHWKLSSKKGKLMVKEYGEIVPNPPIVFLNVSKKENEYLTIKSIKSGMEECYRISDLLFSEHISFMIFAKISTGFLKRNINNNNDINKFIKEFYNYDISADAKDTFYEYLEKQGYGKDNVISISY